MPQAMTVTSSGKPMGSNLAVNTWSQRQWSVGKSNGDKRSSKPGYYHWPSSNKMQLEAHLRSEDSAVAHLATDAVNLIGARSAYWDVGVQQNSVYLRMAPRSISSGSGESLGKRWSWVSFENIIVVVVVHQLAILWIEIHLWASQPLGSFCQAGYVDSAPAWDFSLQKSVMQIKCSSNWQISPNMSSTAKAKCRNLQRPFANPEYG